MKVGDLVKSISPQGKLWIGLIIGWDTGYPIVFWDASFPEEREYREQLEVISEH